MGAFVWRPDKNEPRGGGARWSAPRLRGHGEQSLMARKERRLAALFGVCGKPDVANRAQTEMESVSRCSAAYHGLASEARSTGCALC